MKAKWLDGIEFVFDKLKPEALLHYGENTGYDFGDLPVKYFSNTAFKESR